MKKVKYQNSIEELKENHYRFFKKLKLFVHLKKNFYNFSNELKIDFLYTPNDINNKKIGV